MEREVLRSSAVSLCPCVRPYLSLSRVLCVYGLHVTLTLPRFSAPLLIHCSLIPCVAQTTVVLTQLSREEF